MNNIDFVENLILVRNEPHIYAFSTNTIPNYLKVGDTFRSVDIRIEEWNKKISAALGSDVEVKLTKEFAETAVINDAYFRDYSVHEFLQVVLGKSSLEEVNPEKARLYSREFFEGVEVADVEKAIADIHDDYNSDDPNKKYTYYKLAEKKPADFHYNHDQPWELRPNQRDVVDSFMAKRDQKELLMYAVMRFGKSFTAMYCALQSQAKKVLIVSAKADVVGEWKATVEKPICFSEYEFLVDKNFVNDKDAIQHSIDKGKKVAVFLTLQNLSGKDKDGNNIKKKLAEAFATEYDLIIVDETHFGAWAQNYGAALKNAEEDAQSLKDEIKEQEDFSKKHATLKSKQKLHLSGTPYNLLYDKKFEADNMIATVQFSDILSEKEVWDETHFADIENGVINETTGKPYQEFDNPYFGFPRMLRFAFNPTQETRDKLTVLSKNGKWTLTEMFTAKNGDFVHKDDVLKLLKIIDGSDSAEDILSFLDIPKIKDHDVCKHMVVVLPYKSSCDAMEKLLKDHASEFIHLNGYKVLNVAGHNCPAELATVEKVKQVISACENANPLQKTITLTVNKMLTGVTVKEWDTMIMLKNTHSAQEYDQAVFRIQNQYVVEYEASDGSIMKKDMKPQTILVDFDPMRIFEIQGTSSNIVSAISNKKESLTKALETELKYFPIVTYNGTKLVQVQPNNIVEIITQYNSQKSILDETSSFVVDDNIMVVQYLVDFIKAQNKLGLSNALTADGHTGKNSPMDIPPTNGDEDDEPPTDGTNTPTTEGQTTTTPDDKKDFNQKFRMCMANVLFYVFLSNSKIESLNDVLDSLKASNPESKRNNRIFNHLKLDAPFIKLLSENCSTSLTIEISNKIKNANLLSNDSTLSPEQRANNALSRFSRISDSEVVTPKWICNDMFNCMGVEKLVEIVENGGRILDIAAKTGEFAYALFELLKDKVDIEKLKNSIYSIPTSGATYEFTRRIYEILGLNIHNLANVDNIDSYKLYKEFSNGEKVDYDKVKAVLCQRKPFDKIKLTDTPQQGDENMKFDAIVGNPPYQEKDGGAQASSKPIYNYFVAMAKTIATNYASLITPTRWFTGGKGLDDFRDNMLREKHLTKLHDYIHPEEVFPETNNRGGICFFLIDKTMDNVNMINVTTHYSKSEKDENLRPLRVEGEEIFLRFQQSISIIQKVQNKTSHYISEYLSPRQPFGIESNIVKNKRIFKSSEEDLKNPIKCYGKDKKVGFIEYDVVKSHKNWLNQNKVYIARANNIGTELNDDNLNSSIGIGCSACTEALLFIGVDMNLTEQMCYSVAKYLQTKFARIMHSFAKASHDATSKTFQYVPTQDFTENSDIDWSKSIPEIDAQLYAKYNLTEEEISFIESMIKRME